MKKPSAPVKARHLRCGHCLFFGLRLMFFYLERLTTPSGKMEKWWSLITSNQSKQHFSYFGMYDVKCFDKFQVLVKPCCRVHRDLVKAQEKGLRTKPSQQKNSQRMRLTLQLPQKICQLKLVVGCWQSTEANFRSLSFWPTKVVTGTGLAQLMF